jgi:hypothetical protein
LSKVLSSTPNQPSNPSTNLHQRAPPFIIQGLTEEDQAAFQQLYLNPAFKLSDAEHDELVAGAKTVGGDWVKCFAPAKQPNNRPTNQPTHRPTARSTPS